MIKMSKPQLSDPAGMLTHTKSHPTAAEPPETAIGRQNDVWQTEETN